MKLKAAKLKARRGRGVTPAEVASPSPARASSRAAAGSRVTPTSVVAVLLVLATLGCGWWSDARVVNGARGGAPSTAALTRTTLVCASAQKAGEVMVGTGSNASGQVDVGPRASAVKLSVGGDATATRALDPVQVVRGTGDLAPALFATRSSGPRLAAVQCPATSADQWFTGVGAGAARTSVLELTNPDNGPAVVTVAVYGKHGPVDVPRLRGLAVPGGRTLRVEMAAEIPRRDQLAIHVTSDRGRIAAALIDTYDQLGPVPATTEYLPAQAEPSTDPLILGITSARSRQILVVSNPNDSTAQVQVRLVTEDSVFTPSSAPRLVIDPKSVATVDLGDVLSSKVAEDAFGVALISTLPVTATLRGIASGDLALSVPGAAIDSTTAMAIPAGTAQLAVGGASGVGTVRVVGFNAAGTKISDREAELTPDRGLLLNLPRAVRRVVVTPSRISIHGSLVISVPGTARGTGTTVLPLQPWVLTSEIADVRPGISAESADQSPE